MKIKAKNLKLKEENGLNLEISEIEFDIAIEEIDKFIIGVEKEKEMFKKESIYKGEPIYKGQPVYYFSRKLNPNHLIRVRIAIGDIVKIGPSEDCFSNASTIIYDEKLEGFEGEVINILQESSNGEVVIKKTDDSNTLIKVHPYWLICKYSTFHLDNK